MMAAVLSRYSAKWHDLVRLHDRINDSWAGDLVGVTLIFAGLYGFLISTGGV